ncbi:MAG: right-handed parallel beta-helix repeat-containing protein, partial [Chloroflexota bacterium]
MNFYRLKILNVLVAFILINALAGVQPAYAATLIVVDRADDADISKCTDRANDCSLRGAINLANSYSGATITFAGDYTISISKQLPKVTSLITITGNGSPKTIIQASSTTTNPSEFRIFEVSGNLSLNNLTVRNGRCKNTCNGGGILNNQGVVTVTNSIISGNSANAGGGIYSIGTLNVTNSIISGNTAANYGGGIVNNGSQLVVTNSTISNNTALSIGGGIWNNSKLTITGSNFSANHADYGGGIYNYKNSVTFSKSTFSNNIANRDGGGIW